MALFDPRLSEKPQVVAVNKLDLPAVAERWPELERRFRQASVNPLAISALAGSGLSELMRAAIRQLELARAREVEQPPPVPTHTLEPSPLEFTISREEPDGWRVRGKAIERAAAMTYWEYEEPVRRFQRLLERLGIEQGLRDSGIRPGDTVRIGEHELEWTE
jgi:GTP-binding protein